MFSTGARNRVRLLHMAKRQNEVHRTALPLLQRINAGKFTRTQVAKKLDVQQQHVTNWLRRGIPASRLSDVAALCEISTDEYRLEAGLVKFSKAKQGKLASAPHTADFDALPAGLQDYIERKTRELRALHEALPAWLREKFDSPPKDPAQYATWERDIEGLIAKFRPDGKD